MFCSCTVMSTLTWGSSLSSPLIRIISRYQGNSVFPGRLTEMGQLARLKGHSRSKAGLTTEILLRAVLWLLLPNILIGNYRYACASIAPPSSGRPRHNGSCEGIKVAQKHRRSLSSPSCPPKTKVGAFGSACHRKSGKSLIVQYSFLGEIIPPILQGLPLQYAKPCNIKQGELSIKHYIPDF